MNSKVKNSCYDVKYNRQISLENLQNVEVKRIITKQNKKYLHTNVLRTLWFYE